MPTFHNIPNWLSFENQGGNIASADLDNDGSPELIILRADHPTPGPNRGFYSVGRRLDTSGNVNGGFGPWIEIPDWQSNNNQGAGIAVADFGPNGLALVVFQIQHVTPGPNVGLFRIGRKLDGLGKVTGGWTDWQKIPNWVSFQDQHGAVAVGDIDGDGQPDLVVLHIDDFHTNNPTLPNKGFYRVGSKLTFDGKVANWSDPIEVDWFSWFNQGAGVALADFDGNGRPEIVIFQIDNPPGENAGFYRVGWNLDQQGQVRDGWGPWVKIDGWSSFEDQGGGLALVSFGGRPKAAVFHIDNPPGLNAGLFTIMDLTLDIDQAAAKGIWRLLPYLSEVLPVHAAVLHTGKVLFFAGSGNNAVRFASRDFGNVVKKIYTSVIWDPTQATLGTTTFKHPASRFRGDGSVIDFFCCGHTFLPDGQILVAGGTKDYGFTGTRESLIFDPVGENWTPVQPMANGRWYPTVILLSDGTALVVSGDITTGNDLTNNTFEHNSNPHTSAWVKTRDFNLPLYPHLFQLDDGTVFYTGGKMDTRGASDALIFDPLHPTASTVLRVPNPDQCNQSASVLLPPAQDQKYMLLGGGPEDDGPIRGNATNRVAVIDFKALAPHAYQIKAALTRNRMHVNAVLLPDRTVLAAGGAFTREASLGKAVDPQASREVFEAEIYNPAADTWLVTAPATVARLYHSVALLLPDGRVVAASGNPDKGSQVNWLPPDPLEEMRLEIFSPPYLFQNKPRPVISHVQQEITYGAAVAIQATHPDQVKWVNLIRPGLTTHSFNGTQRVVDVPFIASLPGTLNTVIPSNRNVAPPGWYMLFLTSIDGVPSIASWVHLS